MPSNPIAPVEGRHAYMYIQHLSLQADSFNQGAPTHMQIRRMYGWLADLDMFHSPLALDML